MGTATRKINPPSHHFWYSRLIFFVRFQVKLSVCIFLCLQEKIILTRGFYFENQRAAFYGTPFAETENYQRKLNFIVITWHIVLFREHFPWFYAHPCRVFCFFFNSTLEFPSKKGILGSKLLHQKQNTSF